MDEGVCESAEGEAKSCILTGLVVYLGSSIVSHMRETTGSSGVFRYSNDDKVKEKT